MSSRYQAFYNEQREWNGLANQHQRKNVFRHARKERRTRTYDLLRGDIAPCEEREPELRPVPKFTFRDTISKLIREKKKKPVAKPLPFVVGTVKHKIHSPPFLHGGLGSREQKKKLTPLQLKSFAPSNHKFKPPVNLNMNLATPVGEEPSDVSPFVLNTVWNKLGNKNTSKKNLTHENITMRCRKKRYDHVGDSAGSTEDVNGANEQNTAKRELWPEELSEEPIFGRLNLARKERSLINLPQDNDENKASDYSKLETSLPVLPGASFNSSHEESEEEIAENLETFLDPNVMSTNATMNLLKNPVNLHSADVSGPAKQYEFQSPNSSRKTETIDSISPPKTVFSNTIFNFDNSKAHLDNIDLQIDHLSCSTPAVQDFLKNIPEQAGNLSDSSSSTITSPSEEVTVKFVPGNRNLTIKEINFSGSSMQESPKDHNLEIDNSNLLVAVESPVVSESRPETINLTYTKYAALIEEDEENEDLENSLTGDKIEDKVNSSLNKSILNSSNINEPHVDSNKLKEIECDLGSDDDTSGEIVNNSVSMEKQSLSKTSLQGSETDKIVSDSQENADNESNQLHSDKDGNLNTSKIPIARSSLSKSSWQGNCIGQAPSKIQGNGDNSQAQIDESNNSSDFVLRQTNVNKGENLNKSLKNSLKPPSLSTSSLQDNYIGVSDEAIKESTVHSEESIDEQINEYLNPSSVSSSKQTDPNLNKDGNRHSYSKIPIKVPLSKKSLQNSCADQTLSAVQESTVDSQNPISESINSISEFESDKTNCNKDENSNNSSKLSIKAPSLSKKSLQGNCSDQAEDALNQSTVYSQESIDKQINEKLNSSPVLSSYHTNLNKNGNLNNSSKMSTETQSISKSNLHDNCIEQAEGAIDESTVHSRESKNKQVNEKFNSSTESLSNQTNLNKDENSSEISTETDPKSSVVHNSLEKVVDDCSEASESDQQIAPSNPTSSNIPIACQNDPMETSEDSCSPCSLSSIHTFDYKPAEDKNESTDADVHSSSKKLFDHGETADHSNISRSPPECQVAIANSPQAAENRRPLDSLQTEKHDSDQTLSKIGTPRRVLPVAKLSIKVDLVNQSPIRPEASDEVAHAGPVQAPAAAPDETVIDLTDSPVTPARKSMKTELRKSVLDYKSPMLLSNQKRSMPHPSSEENAVIDLVSDDEDDYTIYLNSLLKKYAGTSKSPKQSPRNRTPLASIGNIPRLSSCQTPQSPLANQVNSPAKKTPILISEVIPVLTDTPRKTPRRRNAVKVIATEAEEAPSPLRVMNLRTRNISVSPSPQKVSRRNTPRKTPAKLIFEQEAPMLANADANLLEAVSLGIENIIASTKNTPRKTPAKRDVAREIVMGIASEDTNHLRVMNLRNRNIHVSPSPQKTPRRRKNDNQCA